MNELKKRMCESGINQTHVIKYAYSKYKYVITQPQVSVALDEDQISKVESVIKRFNEKDSNIKIWLYLKNNSGIKPSTFVLHCVRKKKDTIDFIQGIVEEMIVSKKDS